HCPACLCSLHVDVNPGDRANDCGGVMEPVGAELTGKKGWVIVHRCRRCGEVRRNKAAPDDPRQPDDLSVLARVASSGFPGRMWSPGMAHSDLRLERAGAALRIVIDRPSVLNALTPDTLRELADALTGEAADPAVRAVLITGEGRGFCAGADLAATPVDGDIGAFLERGYHPVVRAIVDLEKPVIAGVNGVAAGAGLSLAAACDLRVASSAAVFALGFTAIGLVMDAGCSFHLPRLIGVGRTMDLALGNRRVDAEEAKAIGLVERVLPAEGFAE